MEGHVVSIIEVFNYSEESHNGIAADLKSADRKVLWVRVLLPPQTIGGIMSYLVEGFLEEQFPLVETRLSRILQHVTDPKSTFAQISASRKQYSTVENEERHSKLKKAVRGLGLGFIEMAGGFKEEDGNVQEKSLFIPGISKANAVRLGNEFEQYSVLWKDGSQFVEIGTNEASGIGKVLNTFKTTNGVLDFDKDAIKDAWAQIYRGAHKDKKFLFVLERSDVSWWTEWTTSKRSKDDSSLWFRIL